MNFYIDTRKHVTSEPSSSKAEVENLSALFLRHASKTPQKVALQYGASERQYLYEDLCDLVYCYQESLKRNKFSAGDRILILAKASADLYALFYAMCSLNIAPVFIDVDMGVKAFLRALKSSRVKAVVAEPALLKAGWILPFGYGIKRFAFSESGLGFDSLKRSFPDYLAFPTFLGTGGESPVLITYTTGSTGQPKGAERTHSVLYHQYRLSRQHWPDDQDEVDMPWFPMVVFQNLNCGITTVVPNVDFRKIDRFDEAMIAKQIEEEGVTRMAAPPSVYDRLCRWLNHERRELSKLRRLIVGGAAVSKRLAQGMRSAFPGAQITVVYGSTEAEPIAHVSLDEVLSGSTNGYLVGRPIPEIDLEICELPEGAEDWMVHSRLDRYRASGIGEILISGPHVVRRYTDNVAANRQTKLRDKDGRIWHRTGDLGYRDTAGRLWLVGRSSDGVTYPVEHEVEMIKGVARSGLVGKVLFVEPEPQIDAGSLLEPVSAVLKASMMGDVRIEALPKIPTDPRHHWKVDRKALASLIR